MEHVGVFNAILLGLLQGATEFLPVSSSGHLVLVEYFLDIKGGGIAFDVFLHIGTLFAVIVYFWRDWLKMLLSLRAPSLHNQDFRLLIYLAAATVPGAIVGALMEGWVEHTLRSPWVVVFTLITVAFVLYAADRTSSSKKTIDGVGLMDALLIGLSQALAVVPGVSRSGITMSTGLFIGLGRGDAARFSFLLSCPIILGAGLFEGSKLLSTGAQAISMEFFIGLVAAFISGILVISFLLRFLRTRTFFPFVIYRIVLGIVVAMTLYSTAHGASFPRKGIQVIERNKNSVVNITTKTMEEENAFATTSSKGVMSGFILDHEGHVVTDGQLIVDKRSIEVTLSNGERWPAKFLGEDPYSKLSVIKIQAPQKVLSSLRPVPLSGGPMPLTGQAVWCLGNPYGLETASAKAFVFLSQRSVATPQGHVLDRIIELDRPLPIGLSGGPVIDEKGRVVGMLTSCFYAQAKGPRETAFALPVSLILRYATSIIRDGKVEHPRLGAICKTITPQLASLLRLPVESGVLVYDVEKGSPAWRAGLRGGSERVRIGNHTISIGGDVIVEVDGEAVKDVPSLLERLEEVGPGHKVVFGIIRKGKKRRLVLYL